jgi:tetratricopeptide (TPR) repeat protein
MISGFLNLNIDSFMRHFLILSFSLISIISFGQESKWGNSEADSIRCYENYNNFGSLYNGRSYVEAFDPWLFVYNTCPEAKEVIYKIGPKIINAKIKTIEDSLKRHELISLLLKVHDDNNIYFPGKEASVLAKKAYDFYKYYPKNHFEAYKMFNVALNLDPASLQTAYLNKYFNAVVNLYRIDSLDTEGLLNGYSRVGESAEAQTNNWNKRITILTEKDTLGTISSKEKRILANDKKRLNQVNSLYRNIEKKIAPLLTCDRLSLIYNEENLQVHIEDASWLRRAEKMLSKERIDTSGLTDCTDNPIYYLIAQSLYDLDPSPQSARSMGLLSIKNEKWDEAITYFSSAIDGEVDPMKKSRDHMRISQINQKVGNLSSAKKEIVNASKLNPSSGEIYLIWASIYAQAAGQCGNNVFEKNAVYWAAVNKLNQAKNIDPEIAVRANKAIANYKKGFPDKSISFQFGYKEGDSYRIPCWINETVRVAF